MNKPKVYKTLSEIPTRNYIGYYWDCQSKEPIQLSNQREFDFKNWPAFPFILEGFLYYKEEKEEYSISIRYTDRYHIHEYDLKSIRNNPDAELERYEYISHPQLSKESKLQFNQLWLSEPDPLCEGNMTTLRMKARLFTGFINTSNN